MKLDKVLEDLNSHYKSHKNTDWIRGHIPILFFGDLHAYLNSDKKIITVGLNPSDKEFLEHRFNTCPDLLKKPELYLDSLCNYFKFNPYADWFSGYENLLKEFESSFYSGEKNTAIHTDFITPIATSPTWTELSEERLSKDEHNELFFGGNKLWRLLLDELKPDFILGAIGQKHIRKVFKGTKLMPISPLIEKGGGRQHKINLFNCSEIPFFQMLADNRNVPAFPKEQSREVANYIKAELDIN